MEVLRVLRRIFSNRVSPSDRLDRDKVVAEAASSPSASHEPSSTIPSSAPNTYDPNVEREPVATKPSTQDMEHFRDLKLKIDTIISRMPTKSKNEVVHIATELMVLDGSPTAVIFCSSLSFKRQLETVLPQCLSSNIDNHGLKIKIAFTAP